MTTLKLTPEEQSLYDIFTASVFQRGYEKGFDDGKEEATISYQNAYDEGHVDGYAKGVDDRDSDIKSGYINGYNKGLEDAWIDYDKGLNDAWEFIKKFGKKTVGENKKIFGNDYTDIYCVVNRYEPSEVIAKIKEYEDKQKAPSVAGCCSILEDFCPYNIKCEECEVHCSVERAKQKLKGDKE